MRRGRSLPKSPNVRNICVTLGLMSEQPIIYSDLREALRRSGLTRADLARRAGMQPAGIRRIFGKNNNHNPTAPCPDELYVTASTAAGTANSTKPSTPSPSPKSADQAPKAEPTTNANSLVEKPKEKPSDPSNAAYQTASGPTSTTKPPKI